MEGSRRWVLRALGAGATAGLAGCAGDSLVAPPGTSESSPDWTNPERSAKLAPDRGDEWDDFGFSLSLSRDGNTALVGARPDDSDARDTASANVFSRTADGWRRQARLVPQDGTDTDPFNHSMALSRDGSTVLVGELGTMSKVVESRGKVHVFERSSDGWHQQATLKAPNGDDSFGVSLALSGDGSTVLVGADDDDSSGVRAGSAFAFSRSGGKWGHREQLVPNDLAEGDHFGSAVALSRDGTTALVGAGGDEGRNGSFRGSAYVFSSTKDGWRQRAKLVPDGGTEDLGYSLSLAADGQTALVGAPSEDTTVGRYAGAAYVFARSGETWEQQARLTLDDAAAKEGFGVAVGLSATGRTALVGTIRDGTVSERRTGSAYAFSRSAEGWRRRAKLVPHDRREGDQFGSSLALSGDARTAFVGASYHDGFIEADTGATYVYEA